MVEANKVVKEDATPGGEIQPQDMEDDYGEINQAILANIERQFLKAAKPIEMKVEPLRTLKKRVSEKFLVVL